MKFEERASMALDPDSCELLRAVARRPAQCDIELVDQLASRMSDWDPVITAAQEHGVLAMLFLRLQNQRTSIPSTILERIRAAYNRNVFHSLTNAAELIGVLREFEENRIPAMPFKGVVLSASVYHDLATRPAGDLDLLIFYRDLARATAVLVQRGYVLKTEVEEDGSPAIQDYFEYHFERQSDGMVIELRWRLELTRRRFRRNLGMDWVWPRRRTTMLAGAKVPDLDPVTALLMLCMHGSKHTWSRLIWVCDVARLLEAYPNLDWDGVMHESKRVGLWRTLALGIQLAHRIAKISLPEAILREFESDSVANRLAKHIAKNIFDSPGSTPQSRVPYHVEMLDLRDRVSLLFSLEFLKPNERDRAAIALPKGLAPLYYLIRPLRILLDRSAR
jgi:hypothetical protein